MLHIGHGYDVHAFAEGRRLILGGVNIPYERGLDGHSDADVLAHALMDALLGAMRADDIGQLFPDNDPAYEGADSLVLLSRVADLAREQGYRICDCDCTVAAQAPKLAPHRQQMRENLAHAMGIDLSSFPLIAGMEGPHHIGDEIRLRLHNLVEEVSGISWTVDGAAVANDIFVPTKEGPCTVKAVISYPDGSEETLVKTIKVEANEE